MADNGAAAAKGHRAPQAGAKFNKKKARDRQKKGIDKGQKNPKVSNFCWLFACSLVLAVCCVESFHSFAHDTRRLHMHLECALPALREEIWTGR